MAGKIEISIDFVDSAKQLFDLARSISNPAEAVAPLPAEHGIEIPNLCNDPRLRPTGSCRLCVVEVAGQRNPVR